MKILGITGGVAEGKSTVLTMIRELGHDVVSCDELAREVFETDEVIGFIAQYRQRHPQSSQPLRDQARRWMLSDPQFKADLEKLMHSHIVHAMMAHPAMVAEVPLLFECGLDLEFQKIWVVNCGPEIQLYRLTKRLGSEAEARALISTQISREERESRADRIIDTSLPLHAVREQVRAALAELFPAPKPIETTALLPKAVRLVLPESVIESMQSPPPSQYEARQDCIEPPTGVVEATAMMLAFERARKRKT